MARCRPWHARMLVAALAFGCLVTGGYRSVPLSAAPLPAGAAAATDTSPPLNQTWRMAAHNAYHWNRSFEAFASGPSQHLMDDAYIDRMRGIELDLHYTSDGAGEYYRIYHTDRPSNALCAVFTDCLKALRAFHYGNPNHDVFMINLEVKNTNLVDPFFTPGLSPWALDASVARFLGPNLRVPPGAPPVGDDWVFGPSDYYEWCAQKITGGGASVPPGTPLFGNDLKDAVRKCGWPTLAELRGRFILTMHASWYSNAVHVYDYSNGPGRNIGQAKIFPMAEVFGTGVNSDCGTRNVEYARGGVCNWGLHSVFAEVAEGVMSSPERYPYFSWPAFYSPLAAIQQFVREGGMTRYLGELQTAAEFANRQTGLPAEYPAPNQMQTDAPSAALVNFDRDRLADPNPSGRLDWSSGCRFESGTGCSGPLHEENFGISLKVAGGPGPGLGGTSDRVAFLSMPRWNTETSLRGFPSNRTNYRPETAQATITPNWGCLMARQDATSANAPFFAICRKGHGEFHNDPPYALWRTYQGGPTNSTWLGNDYVTTGNIAALGNAEIAPYLELQHDRAGRCWSAYARSTDDPDAAALGPQWIKGHVASVCFAAPLNAVGVAADGGSRADEGYTGETLFANLTYGQTGEHLTRGTLTSLTRIGAIAGLDVAERTYAVDRTSPRSIDLTGLCDGCTYDHDLTVTIGSDGTRSHMVGHLTYGTLGAQYTPATVVPYEWDAGGAIARFTVNANGETTIWYQATDTAGNVEPMHAVRIRIAKGIANAGFESGTLDGWTRAGTTAVAGGAHGGGYAVRTGASTPTLGDSSVSQAFVAPPSANLLSFWYSVTCPEIVSHGWATATLYDQTTGTSSAVLPRTCSNNQGWRQASAPVVGGHGYTLTLTSHDDNYPSDPTSAVFDDVALTAGPANGGFESGDLTGWARSGTVGAAVGGHAGAFAAQAGLPTPTTGDSSIWQTFTAPAAASQLSFWYDLSCPDTLTYAWATATLLDTTTGVTTTVLPRTCTNGQGWRQASAPVVGGHAYTLTLTNHDDGYYADPVHTRYDDITLG